MKYTFVIFVTKRAKKRKWKKKSTAIPAIKTAKKTFKKNGSKTNHKTLC